MEKEDNVRRRYRVQRRVISLSLNPSSVLSRLRLLEREKKEGEEKGNNIDILGCVSLFMLKRQSLEEFGSESNRSECDRYCSIRMCVSVCVRGFAPVVRPPRVPWKRTTKKRGGEKGESVEMRAFS